jgi:hypothetical protein
MAGLRKATRSRSRQRGGTTPYSWSLGAGSALPPGLTIGVGSLSGTPTLPILSAFFLKASDSAGHSVQKAFSLTVLPALNPVPTLASISPTSAEQGTTATVTLTGTGFVPSSEARWDGTPIPTTFQSQTTLSASVSASLLAASGVHQLSVFSPVPGGGTSTNVSFTVSEVPQNPVPTIASITPTQLPTSGTDTQIAIVGTNFNAVTSAAIGVSGITTSYVSPTSLNATIPASYLASAGTLQIGVYNPPPGGGFSTSTVSVTVGTLNPVPTLSTLSPASIVAGHASFTLGVTGTKFVSGGQVFFNSTALATTVVNATTASAAVPASLVTTAGSATVTFVNPLPGGGACTGLTFTVSAVGVDAGSECTGTAQYLLAHGTSETELPTVLGCPAQNGFSASTTVLDLTQPTNITLFADRSTSEGPWAYSFLREGCNFGAPNLASNAGNCRTTMTQAQPGRYTVVRCNFYASYIEDPLPVPTNVNTSCAAAMPNPTNSPVVHFGAQHRVYGSEKLYFRVDPTSPAFESTEFTVKNGDGFDGGKYRLQVQTECDNPLSTVLDSGPSSNNLDNGNTCVGAHVGVWASYHASLPSDKPYWIVLSEMAAGLRPSIDVDLY